MKTNHPLSRRTFIRTATAGAFAFILPGSVRAAVRSLAQPVKLGLIADLHQDIMHDGLERMQAFVREMEIQRPDALIQLGDFAYPNEKNQAVIDLFNGAHAETLHVIGNHDTDAGHTKEQCLEVWNMPGRYYTRTIAGIKLIVLDGNDTGSPTHRGGYVSYIGEEQRNWLADELDNATQPVIIISHQPLAGTIAVDNAAELQDLLGKYASKILLAINGHSHVDDLLRIQGITYLHLNSASYQWVGGDFQHQSYSEAIHRDHPWISHTCPYRDSLFATLIIEPDLQLIRIEGRSSEWVGPSPAALGTNSYPGLHVGEEVAPRIRDRRIELVGKS
ncbi:metallophosphoesterase family protein [Flavilitoribacter nigricans]|uniref:Alkaline phosphatase n=1 Tax=Flavilitoribacter nigricans (strain ATCC 23147 / DSM 23189 / NBRC 102662 / NCIMB 1420 / SS-2) TaxID=1122177 RepID=A0A2D0N7T7_FLAN2|nr:metallophosphoesterase [Flavilitoribacter nigricans]PHN04582.1 alkaline phosphatase [Flavilitoribacter nigricans DSM 23189 = NBRC 102662]